MRDTDIRDDDANQQADRNAVPDAERTEPADAEAYDSRHRADDLLSGDEEAEARVPSDPDADSDLSADDEAETRAASAADADNDLRSDDEEAQAAAAATTTEEPTAAPMTDEPTAATDEDRSAELLPGEASAEPAAAGWADGAAEDMRARWQDLQLRFVDDPSGVATEARALVGEAVQAMTDALTEQQHRLDSWSTDDVDDTEQLRVVVQQYRDFFDRMLDRAI